MRADRWLSLTNRLDNCPRTNGGQGLIVLATQPVPHDANIPAVGVSVLKVRVNTLRDCSDLNNKGSELRLLNTVACQFSLEDSKEDVAVYKSNSIGFLSCLMSPHKNTSIHTIRHSW